MADQVQNSQRIDQAVSPESLEPPCKKRKMVTPITLVTGNAGKLREFNAILGSIVEMKAADVDLPELQGDKISLFLEYILNRLSFFR
jgi:hypothetical protein